jgi:hypothetical protein
VSGRRWGEGRILFATDISAQGPVERLPFSAQVGENVSYALITPD